MAKQPEAPANTISFWTGAALVWFDGRGLGINKPSGPNKGVSTYSVNQISGIQISRPSPLALWVFRILVAGEAAPRGRRTGMLELTKDPFVVQFNSKLKAQAEAVAQAVRDAQAALRQPAAAPMPQPAAPGLAEQIQQLAALHTQGVLSDAEFAAAKAKVLGGGGPQDAAGPGW